MRCPGYAVTVLVRDQPSPRANVRAGLYGQGPSLPPPPSFSPASSSHSYGRVSFGSRVRRPLPPPSFTHSFASLSYVGLVHEKLELYQYRTSLLIGLKYEQTLVYFNFMVRTNNSTTETRRYLLMFVIITAYNLTCLAAAGRSYDAVTALSSGNSPLVARC